MTLNVVFLVLVLSLVGVFMVKVSVSVSCSVYVFVLELTCCVKVFVCVLMDPVTVCESLRTASESVCDGFSFVGVPVSVVMGEKEKLKDRVPIVRENDAESDISECVTCSECVLVFDLLRNCEGVFFVSVMVMFLLRRERVYVEDMSNDMNVGVFLFECVRSRESVPLYVTLRVLDRAGLDIDFDLDKYDTLTSFEIVNIENESVPVSFALETVREPLLIDSVMVKE